MSVVNQSYHMQGYSHANNDGTREAVERFEELIHSNKESYFDVSQIESIFDFYNENNMMDKAISVLQMGLRQHPDSTSLQLKYSTLLLEQHQDEESLEILNYLKLVETGNSEVFLNLGIIYTRWHKKEDALNHFSKALKLADDEELEDFVFEIGFNLNLDDYNLEARNLLIKYQPQYPNNENILFELAYAHDKLDELEQGISVYNTLLDLNPYLENAWYNMGILLSKQEKFQEAIEAYKITIALDPDLSEAYFNMANSLAQVSEYNEALNVYAEYMSYNYPSPLTYYYMGDCWENMDNHNFAFRFYSLAVEIDPENIEALLALGKSSYLIQDYATSVSAFEKAQIIDSNAPGLWLSLGKTYKKMNKSALAKKCLKQALLTQDQDTYSWIEMYQFLEESEKNFNALTFLKRVLHKDRTNGALHYLAAVIYNKSNHNEDALRHLVIARQLLPDDLEIVLNEYPALVSMPKIAEYLNSQH